MAADGDGDGEKPPFRWLDAAMYVVASVVTVLIVAVIVNAIKVVLRPESLLLSVDRGTVFVKMASPDLQFYLNLQEDNPSGRVRMYFVNVTAYLFDKDTPASSSNPH